MIEVSFFFLEENEKKGRLRIRCVFLCESGKYGVGFGEFI
jgi:hypothetical protein